MQSAREIEELDIVATEPGVELRMWLAPERADRITVRQRRLAGPSGCGLCGLESLVDVVRTPPHIASAAGFDTISIHTAMAALPAAQKLNQQTRAVHAAAFWHPAHGLVALREDVGRHNALDKLGPARSPQGADVADGLVLLSSRISVEMVQKAAMLGAPVVVAVSAPTALAVRMADEAGITLIGIAAPTASRSSPIPSVSPRSRCRMSPDKLAYMANQIGKFFAHQQHEKAVAAIADI